MPTFNGLRRSRLVAVALTLALTACTGVLADHDPLVPRDGGAGLDGGAEFDGGAKTRDGGSTTDAELRISSFMPTSGTEGASVTITGAGFDTSPSLDEVRFNGYRARVTAASSSSLTAIVPVGAQTGRITVMVGGKTATSADDFTVEEPPGAAPTIVTQPVSLTVTPGERATFTVGAAGDAPLRYQWALGGQSISGATEDHYTIDQVTLAHAGSYSVTVSNPVASVESTAATLTVTSSSSGGCEPGSTSTAWASSCPTKAAACTPGTWVAGGPDPEHSGFRKLSESAHFVVYSDENPSGAQAAVDSLETAWSTYFGSPMFMKEPLCDSTTKYKVSVHVHSDWGLTGGSWEAGRMGMWIGTGGLADHWGLAHEFRHGVQSVAGGMRCNQSNTCGWVYESDANWAPQQLEEYHTRELHCSELRANATHLYLGSTRDRYCNWQFLEFLKDKHCFSAVNEIWTGPPTNDPFTTIMNSQKWNVSQLNDFFGEWAMHNVTWDYQDPPPQSTAGKNQGALYRSRYGLVTDTSQATRRLRLTKLESLDADFATNRRFVSPFHWAPQRWGYNVVRLYPDAGASSVTVTFRGVSQSKASADFRWGLVATDGAITTPRYSPLQRGTDGQLTLCVNSGEALFLVVMGTPSVFQQIVWDQPYGSIYRYPYMVQLANAWPDGFQGGAPAACPSGTTRIQNGGGCGPATLPSSVYVGPYAQILGGTVSGNARIEDHARVLSGSVSSGTVGGLTLLSGFNVATSGTVRTSFYPLGFFESGQGLSGSASLVGDVEFRGQGYNRSSGTCSGFVDSQTCEDAAEVTLAPPYQWRP